MRPLQKKPLVTKVAAAIHKPRGDKLRADTLGRWCQKIVQASDRHRASVLELAIWGRLLPLEAGLERLHVNTAEDHCSYHESDNCDTGFEMTPASRAFPTDRNHVLRHPFGCFSF